MLAGQSLGPAGCGALGCSTPMLSPCPSGGAPLSPDAPRGLPTMHPHHHLPQHQAQQAQHSQAHTLAAALGQLAAQAGGRGPAPLAPPSPGAHHGLPPMHAGGGAAALNGSLPHHFYCPLTRQLMSDPVLAADGVTYERQAIAEWMAYKDVSPTTQLPLPHKVLSPNSVLRAGLLDLLRQHC
ncbi:hypothetical protein CHLNCDRAFT_142667 [Chlorella variabilis]|uniref:U-box domain-containing protein n=1 Tax=Chlorella variabilis TaxID=554065 RepID=E1ZUN0_CHLVA|nr:hypothetical protein CHLNCDRAFT_142667 [Chlorella variabilis]EFN50465.1 hypothetical protein CHLNCDRAFT_142667 [Chlorella variabilis]|eukprot:XP_005842597.1 hypothetical protein CHLNCDRAFT_142667 [Chlorella variabilis]